LTIKIKVFIKTVTPTTFYKGVNMGKASIADIELTVTIPLKVCFKHISFRRGAFEKGGRQLEPDEPAHYEILSTSFKGITMPPDFTELY
jgi:hypothetical protein